MRDNEARKVIETAIRAAYVALLTVGLTPERETELRARISRLETALRTRRTTTRMLKPVLSESR